MDERLLDMAVCILIIRKLDDNINRQHQSTMDREGLEFLAKLAENAERYEEMADHVKTLAETATTELSVEERNLLSVAYKNVTGMRRASWRIVSAIQKYDKHRDNDHSLLSVKLRTTIEDELTQICEELMTLVDDKLLPLAKSADAKVFYLKMKGDCGRYMAEYTANDADQRKRVVNNALRDYELAQQIAEAELVPTNVTRLGLALNHSVFDFDILNDTTAACKLAKRFRRRHCRARHAVRRVVQGQHAHHAVAARQPHALDQ